MVICRKYNEVCNSLQKTDGGFHYEIKLSFSELKKAHDEYNQITSSNDNNIINNNGGITE